MSVEIALRALAEQLAGRRVPFAVVGGIAASIRGEVRFTRGVDVAIVVATDEAVERLVRELRGVRYEVRTLVEHVTRGRIATVRLRSPTGILTDLLTASSGIEDEVVAHATGVFIEGIGEVPVAAAEELLALKVLSMGDRRLQDRLDARNILLANPEIDLHRVRARLAQIRERGYDRGEALDQKLEQVRQER
ncbi:MAG: hypothetical protein WCI05_17570 [Myxococcales bacterium]